MLGAIYHEKVEVQPLLFEISRDMIPEALIACKSVQKEVEFNIQLDFNRCVIFVVKEERGVLYQVKTTTKIYS